MLHRFQLEKTDEDVEKAFRYLEDEGFINKQLYNPRRTKQEYFWLMLIHVILNVIAICIEIINGAVDTDKGKYVTWDIRMLSFVLGLVFLCSYYKKFHILKHKTRHRTGSLDDLLRTKIFKKWGHRKTLSTGNIPDMEQIMKEIEAIWWENPTRKLVLNEELKEKMLHRFQLEKTDQDIEKAFRYLEYEGFINKQLYSPRRTKQEYFWLMLIHVLLNFIAICIEIINGAVDTDKGKYVTWDIRMLSFVLGLVFLCSYYKKFHILKNKTRHRTGSLDDLLRTKIFKKWGHRKTLSTGNIPDMEQIMKEIEAIWWENPTRKLVLNEELKEKMLHRFQLEKTDQDIEKAFRYLEYEGFINKQLYSPRRTKQEYFWLMLIHVLLNFIAICIEIINGAVDTDKGKYVTWDIRMLSFVLGLVFLCSYYKKFHILKDLTRTHLCGLDGKYCKIFCCYKDDRPMSAIPDYEVMQKCLQRPESNYRRYKNVETQTSELFSNVKGEESESIHKNENLTDERKIEKLVQCN
jgi:DNA-binding HxlR family transcriptional regulator